MSRALNVTLQQLEFFRAVATNSSFSRAAEELYTSQPYVSQQIRKLEEHYGVPLFIRSYPHVTLSDAGQALFGRVGDLLDGLDGLEHLAQEFVGVQRGTLRVAATTTPGNHLMPDLLASFRSRYPAVTARVRIGNTEQVNRWLEQHEVEVGVSPLSPSDALEQVPFHDEPLGVIVPAQEQLPDPLPIATFRSLPKVVREPGSITYARLREVLGKPRDDDTIVAQLTGTSAVNEAVAAGLGIALVSVRSAKAWLDAGSVRLLQLEGAPMHHQFYLMYSSDRFLSPLAKAFVDHLLDGA